MTAPLSLPTLALVLLLAGVQASPDEALLDAAQQNDLPEVRRALERGANVNAKTRYNATALLFAATNANMEMVRLLVDRDADLTVEDTFYGFTAIGMAEGNTDIVRYLIEAGSPGASDALALAVAQEDLSLLEAAAARDDVADSTVAASYALVVDSGNTEMASVLEAAMSDRPGAANSIVTLSPSDLEVLSGTYRRENGGTIVITYEDGRLRVNLEQIVTLFPISSSNFIAPQRPAIGMAFDKQDDVDQLVLTRPARSGEDPTLVYTRTTEVSAGTSEPTGGPTSSPTETDLAVAPRGTGRPWASFRGTGASGVADGQGAVVEWDVTTQHNVRWKTPVPGVANSSPVVWGDRLFVTTAISGSGDNTFRTGLYGDVRSVDDLSEHVWKLYALDNQTGEVRWEREVHRGIPRTKRHTKGSQASSTSVTDGRRVVVLFGTTGVLAAYDMDGALLWKKDLGLIDNGWFFDATEQWGHSSSPIIYLDSVILQVDRQKDSFVAAYDLSEGEELWRTSRDDEIPTWGTPTIATGESGDELITNGTKVRGYDPETGRLRWSLAPNSEITVATPVVGPSLAYVTGGYPPVRPIYAIRPGSSGDISLTGRASSNDAIAWSSDRGGTYIPTPILYRGLFYTLNSNGIITAYEAETGERVYRARVGTGGAFSASPVAADGRLYIASEDGDVFVARAGREYFEIAHNEIDGVIMAPPAISDGLIVIRTVGHVYGFGEEPDPARRNR